MAWINRIEWSGGRLTPVAIDEHGAQKETSLKQLRVHLPPQQYSMSKLHGLALKSLERVESSEYLAEFGLERADPHGHEIFGFDFEGRRALVPAVVLLCSVLTRLSEYGDRLLDAASLDALAHPAVHDKGVAINFRRGVISKAANSQDLQGLFTWLSCFPSARRFWSSVYLAARTGVLGCTPPLAAVDATLRGHCSATTVFVTRMSIKSLTPLEPPLPFAVGKVPSEFRFSVARTENSAALLRAFRSKGMYRPPAQDGIPRGPDGWKTTTEEWRSVVARLKTQGFVCKLSSKASLDLALEKHGSGELWGEENSQMTSAQSTYSHWNKNGKWEALKSALRDLRAPSGDSKSPARDAPQLVSAPIPKAPWGWKTSDQEWLAIVRALSSDGFVCKERSKVNIDFALEKLGSGRQWREVAPGNSGPPTLYSLWNRTGRWDVLVRALSELRTNASESADRLSRLRMRTI